MGMFQIDAEAAKYREVRILTFARVEAFDLLKPTRRRSTYFCSKCALCFGEHILNEEKAASSVVLQGSGMPKHVVIAMFRRALRNRTSHTGDFQHLCSISRCPLKTCWLLSRLLRGCYSQSSKPVRSSRTLYRHPCELHKLPHRIPEAR